MLFISQNVFTPTLEDMEVILKKLGESTITITQAQAQKLQRGEAIMMLTWDNPPISHNQTTRAWYLVTGMIFIDNGANAIIYFNNGNADGNDMGIVSDYIRIQG